MDVRQSPLLLGFSVGYWFRTNVRVSFLFPLLVVFLCFRLGVRLGLIVSGILIVSIIAHEFAHVFAARRTGGTASEIVLWPLGGLAMTSPAASFTSEFWTVAAGPISNALLCLAGLPVLISHGMVYDSMRLIYLPSVTLSGPSLLPDLVALTFSVNFLLLLVNLLPIYPLDGGQIALAVAKRSWDGQTARLGTMWVGMILCILFIFVGWAIKVQDVTFLGFMLIVFVMHEYFMTQIHSRDEDSFLGYDFSQGYTSLERSDQSEPARRLGPLERWRARRDAERREREEKERLETERRVDELLQKVHDHGMDSLTEAERRFLQKASSRYRSQDQS